MNTLVSRHNTGKKVNNWLPGVVFTATTLMSSVCAFAEEKTLASLAKSIQSIIVDVYNGTVVIVTVLAILLAGCALIVKMAGNQRASQTASAWLVRIIACYAAFNCLGLLFNVIQNTTKEHNVNSFYEEFNGGTGEGEEGEDG